MYPNRSEPEIWNVSRSPLRQGIWLSVPFGLALTLVWAVLVALPGSPTQAAGSSF